MSETEGEARISPTPLLDRVEPLPDPPSARPRARVKRALFGAAIGACVPVALEIVDPSLARSLRERVVSLPSQSVGLISGCLQLVAAVVLAVVVHEVGHVLGGLAAGFRFNQLRIGPIQIDRPFRPSLQRMSGSGAVGWASLFPTRRDGILARAALFVLGGPGSNLLSAAVLLLLPISKGFFAWSFVVVSLLLGVSELLPIRRGSAVPDGRRLLLLLRDPRSSRRWLALMRLSAELRQGVLPEALSPEYLADALAQLDQSPDTVAAHALAYGTAFHQRRDDEAAMHLETSLRYSPWISAQLREAVLCDAAVFQARRRRRADLAEQWLAAMKQPLFWTWTRPTVEAAILEARGEVEGALAKLAELERAYREYPDRALGSLFERLLERWRSELRRDRPALAPGP